MQFASPCQCIVFSLSLNLKLDTYLIMAALRSKCGHYIFVLFLLLFSSPNLSGRRLDVYRTCTHGVAVVRI